MTSYQITNKKDFMGKLLASDCFSSFLLKEAGIHSYVPFTIDGHINRDFFEHDKEEAELSSATDPQSEYIQWEYIPWERIRPACFNLIKGKHAPTSFWFVLYLKPEAMEALFVKEELSLENLLIRNLILNIRFDNGKLCLTTAVDYSGFSMDRSGEQLWDLTVRKFLSKKEIDFE